MTTTMTTTYSDTVYSVDHDGIDGRWRVWWTNPQGYSVERLFETRGAALDWIDFVESLAG